MSIIPKNPRPHINTVELPKIKPLTGRKREKVVADLLKVIEKSERIAEEFERDANEKLPPF